MPVTENSCSRIFRDGLLRGEVCVVTGAGSGIGRSTALELVALGATVIGCGRREEPLAETASMAEGASGQFEYATLDVREEDAVDGFVADVLGRHGSINSLVNNAGGQFLAPAEEITPKGFRTVIELNLVGTWLMTSSVAKRAFIPGGGGKVVSVTLSPHSGMPGMVHSGAARAGVENMMRTLATEWARFGIKTCAVAPGQIGTDTFMSKYPPVVVENVGRTIPLGHLGRAEDIAWQIVFLLSEAGDFVSGSVITIDGGRDNHFGQWPPTQLLEE